MASQLSLLSLLESPTLEALFKPDDIYSHNDAEFFRLLPEDTRYDKKSSRVTPATLATLLSAFGNGPSIDGGVVAVGIDDNGSIGGCNRLSQSGRSDIESAGRDSCHDGKFQCRRLPCKNRDGQDDFLILIRIFYVESKLVTCTDGNAYCREGDRTRKLTETEKQEIRINKGERAFELEPCNLTYPDDFRIDEIRQFVHKIRISRETGISDEQIMISMRMGRVVSGSFVPNNVCALMFARDPQLVFPGSYVHFLRYNGKEAKTGAEYNVVKDRMINGTLIQIIKETASLLDSNLREFTEFRDGKFYPIPEYPRDAWYEIIVNACVHRSYHDKNSPVFVNLFDDHLTVISPGSFMPQVTPDNLFHKPRNPFLMFALREYGEVRVIGEGTRRIRKEMSDAKLPQPEFVGTKMSVSVSLFNEVANRTNSIDSEAYKVLGEVVAFSLDADERRIVNFVIENKSIKPNDVLKILSTTYWQTAQRKLQRLCDKGILYFNTTKKRDPNSYYTLHAPMIHKNVDEK